MTSNPYESPDAGGSAIKKGWGRIVYWMFSLLVVFGFLALLILMMLPFSRQARPAAYWTQCTSRLKNIGVALHDYEGVHGSLPPAYTVDEQGRPLHSWRTLILPFLEQQELYEKIDLTKPWNDLVNKAAYETNVHTYQCPSAKLPTGHTSYQAVIARNGCLQPAKGRKFAEITDGLDRTLVVIEVDLGKGVHWMSPLDTNLESIVEANKSGKTSPHSGVRNILYADGSIHQTRTNVKKEVLEALTSIDGNEDITAFQND